MISLAELSTHVWACAPNYVELFLEDLAALDLSDLVVPTADDRAPPAFAVENGIAQIPITGMIMREVPAQLKAAGIPATSTKETGEKIAAALADETISAIMMNIDSPGGTLAGTAELADLIFSAREIKPIHAHTEDIAASAAYWLGSQAQNFTASQSAQVGSIGVYRVMIDTSEAAAAAGARVHVIRSGEHKGTGAAGAPITPEQLTIEQSLIDRAAAIFTEAVTRGREAVDVSSAATGRTWLASEAADLGLIDGVMTAGEAAEQIKNKDQKMETNEQPVENAGEKEEVEAMTDQIELIEKEETDVDALKAELKAAQERAAAAEAKAEKEEAKAAAAAASLVGIKQNQKTEAIQEAMNAGKITPAMLASVEAYSEKCGENVAELAEFLAALPVQTKPQTIGSNDQTQIEKPQDKGVAVVAGLFNREPSQVAALADVRAVTTDGYALTHNGGRVRLTEIIKGA